MNVAGDKDNFAQHDTEYNTIFCTEIVSWDYRALRDGAGGAGYGNPSIRMIGYE